MGLHCGIVGLPNVGKSTLFNALTSSQTAAASNYPFCTIEPNKGTVFVPDSRLDFLHQIFKSNKVTPSTIDFIDIAGLVRGSSKGEGLGNQFLSHIREVDAIIHIVRCFEDENIAHIEGKIDPENDIKIVETELILKDLETVSKRLEKSLKSAKSGDKNAKYEVEFLNKLKDYLDAGKLAKNLLSSLHEKELSIVNDLHLLTTKPVLYVANVSDTEIAGNKYSEIVFQYAKNENAGALVLSAKIEADIALLDSEEEKNEFIISMGLKESGLNKLIKESFSLLGLITFFTANERELHSWNIKKGTKAPQAGGKIHTDFERGFIRVEVIKFEDLKKYNSVHAIKEKGLLHLHGHDYVVEDGDILFYRFNV
ncbi:MAG: redox-regulated ATPase YchF [Ignavibacteria bacterium]|nr:redox-regulated ATPase YchF [Ignavibacteria bacterium]